MVLKQVPPLRVSPVILNVFQFSAAVCNSFHPRQTVFSPALAVKCSFLAQCLISILPPHFGHVTVPALSRRIGMTPRVRA